MGKDGPENVTTILGRIREGDPEAASELFSMLYAELHGLAGRIFRSQKKQHTLQPTALVHEAYMKIMRPDGGPTPWQDRAHFLGVAGRAMRQILVNHARDRSAQKRGGGDLGRRVTLSGVKSPGGSDETDVIAVDEALSELEKLDPRQARIAELRFFAGLTNKEVAEVLDRSLRSVELDWKMAKAVLAERLG